MADTAMLVWDQIGEKTYETGTDRGVLFVADGASYGEGVAWSGISSVSEKPSGAEPSDVYADNIKYLSLTSAEKFGGTIEAYQYPDEFMVCDGSAEPVAGVTIGQQNRKGFALSYRTLMGNDTEGENYGYKIHLVYGCKASVSERSFQTMNENPEAMTMSWDFDTTPVPVEGYKPTSLLTIDSTKVSPEKLAAFEKILYGSADAASRLPLPEEVFELLKGDGVDTSSMI